MKKWDNYAVAAAQARKLFLAYDHSAMAEKLHTNLDDVYLYTQMLSEEYRISRITGEIERYHNGEWLTANSFAESLTIFDLVCDSSADRSLTFRWKNMSGFGNQFHSSLLEPKHDPTAEKYESNQNSFHSACKKIGGKPYAIGDAAYILELFDGLCVVLQLWFTDEDFPAQIRWYWDENALQYLKYETMYYACDLIARRIEEAMEEA